MVYRMMQPNLEVVTYKDGFAPSQGGLDVAMTQQAKAKKR